MRTSFHHQPEAQHPKSSAINKRPADYPIYWGVGSIDQCNTARGLSAGVSKPKVLRGTQELPRKDRAALSALVRMNSRQRGGASQSFGHGELEPRGVHAGRFYLAPNFN